MAEIFGELGWSALVIGERCSFHSSSVLGVQKLGPSVFFLDL